MLFDLKGRRRRFIQVIYASLAILMGGGLVLFGIGGEVSGGLFDAFSDNQGDTDSQFQDQLDQAQEQLVADPDDQGALGRKIRASYQLALENADPETGTFGDAAIGYLEDASEAWVTYLELNPDAPDPDATTPGPKTPDAALASLMVQAYSEVGLADPEKATQAASLVAQARATPASYLLLVRTAAQAGDTRTANLAGSKAVQLSDPEQRKTVQEQVDQVIKAGEKAAAQAKKAEGKGGAGPATETAPR
ncbi:MAG: hypothetical protein H0U42_11405 [Thermoleophilaceae bacterium]|nr:hypothetical protein [Thermoleophilaceae bacterium]